METLSVRKSASSLIRCKSNLIRYKNTYQEYYFAICPLNILIIDTFFELWTSENGTRLFFKCDNIYNLIKRFIQPFEEEEESIGIWRTGRARDISIK